MRLWQHDFRPRFAALVGGQMAQNVGDQVLLVALSITILKAAGTGELAFALALWALLRGAFLLLGGAIADAASRRWLAVGTGVLLALVTAGLAIATGVAAMPPSGVFDAAAVVLGILDGLRIPVAGTLVPAVVPKQHLLMANGWQQSASSLALMLGPALGGIVVATIGSAGGFWAVALCYALSALLWCTLPSAAPPATAAPVWRGLAGGLHYIRSHPRLRWLLAVFAISNLFVLGPQAVYLPLLASDVLRGGALALGLLNAAFGCGLVVGTLGLRLLPRGRRQSLGILFGLFMMSDVGFALMGAAPSLALAMAAYALCGLGLGPATTLFRTYLQETTPPEVLGRVTGMARLVSYGLQPISRILAGGLGEVLPVAVLVVASGAAATIVDGLGLLIGLRQERKSVSAVWVKDA